MGQNPPPKSDNLSFHRVDPHVEECLACLREIQEAIQSGDPPTDRIERELERVETLPIKFVGATTIDALGWNELRQAIEKTRDVAECWLKQVGMRRLAEASLQAIALRAYGQRSKP